MTSLHAHLCAADDHAGIPFRADCPICRAQRQMGQLPEAALVPRRSLAGLLATAAVTAFAVPAIGPSAASAAKILPPVTTSQPTPEPTDGPEEPDPPDVDNSDDTDPTASDDAGDPPPPPPPDPPPPPPAPDPPPPPPVDVPPPPAPDAPPPPAADSVPPVADAAPLPVVPPPAPVAPPPAAAPAPAQPAPAPAPAEDASASTASDEPEPTPTRASSRPAPQQAAPISPPPQVERPPLSGATNTSTVRAGDERHVVKPGESLWSIAEDLLGSGASDAKVAQLVSQIWDLNRGSIASGDPDLISAGQELVLPAGAG